MMIIKVDGGIDEKVLEKMINRLETENNVSVKLIAGKDYSILGLVGDISTIDISIFNRLTMYWMFKEFKSLIKERVENSSQKIQL